MKLSHIAIALCDRSPRYRNTLLTKVFGQVVRVGESVTDDSGTITDILFLPHAIIIETDIGSFYVKNLEEVK